MQHTQFYANVNIRTFMKEMTKNAQSLGMYDTFYDSPHGLRNERNFSTAYDVALLTQECMKIQLFRQVVGTRVYEAKALNGGDTRNSTFVKPQTRYKWE